MDHVHSLDAEIAYRILGDGPPIVLPHPFPANHGLCPPVAEALTSRYRLVLPDLRGHGDSGVGEGPATMEKHAADIARVMDEAKAGRAPLIGVSIGGHVIFEFWRRCAARADSDEGRAGRLQAAGGWPIPSTGVVSISATELAPPLSLPGLERQGGYSSHSAGFLLSRLRAGG